MAKFLKAVGTTVKSAFTDSGIESPMYKVIANHAEYEEREYVGTKWVCHTQKAMQHDDAVRKSFGKLFNYIQGKNEKGTVIDMTAPVTVKVLPGAGPNCESTFTIGFFIGTKHQEDPPAPKNAKVFIETWKPFTVYARTFGGVAKNDKWIEESVALAQSLKPEHEVVEEYYFTCGYNSPFKLFNRRNEIWLLKKGSFGSNSLVETEEPKENSVTDTREESSTEEK